MSSIAGGYPNSTTETRATTVANEDIMPLIKAEEVSLDNIPSDLQNFNIRDIGILVDAEMRIRINNGTTIHLDPSVPYNNDIRVYKLETIDAGVTYRLTYNY